MVVTRRRSSGESESSTPSTSRGKGRKDVRSENSAGTPVVVTRLVAVKRTGSVSSSPGFTPPTRRSKRLALDSQDVVSEQTPSPSRRSERTSEDYATPTKRSRRSSTGVSGHQDTPVVHTPRRRRRTPTDARDTPAAPTSVRRSRRLSDISVSECELSNNTPPGSGRSSEEEIPPLPKEIEEQTDSESATETLESISEEEEETPLAYSSDASEVKSVCELEEVQIIKPGPGTLPVIEEEKLDSDSNSEPFKPVSVNEEENHVQKASEEENHVQKASEEENHVQKASEEENRVQKAKTEGLAVIEEVEEEKEDLTNAVKLDESKEEVEKEPALILTEEAAEKLVDEQEQKEFALDTGFDGFSNCSASSTTGVEKDDLVVADETVSTTVTTDEDYISSSGNEIKSDDLDAALDKGLEEGKSKDLEVTSTTNIGVSTDRENKPSDCKKTIPAVNNNNEVSNGKVVLEKPSQLKDVTRGMPISGRWWKKEKQRFRSINKDATGKKSWKKKMKVKQERQNVMARSAAILEEKQRKKDELKKRQQLNKIRREENAKKSEIVQVIKDPKKIKKMKRKQLRYIEKRDTTELQKLQS